MEWVFERDPASTSLGDLLDHVKRLAVRRFQAVRLLAAWKTTHVAPRPDCVTPFSIGMAVVTFLNLILWPGHDSWRGLRALVVLARSRWLRRRR